MLTTNIPDNIAISHGIWSDIIITATAGLFSSSVKYPAMGVALYRWGVMAQSNSSSDSSLDEESLRRTSAGAEFQSLTVRGKKENL